MYQKSELGLLRIHKSTFGVWCGKCDKTPNFLNNFLILKTVDLFIDFQFGSQTFELIIRLAKNLNLNLELELGPVKSNMRVKKVIYI